MLNKLLCEPIMKLQISSSLFKLFIGMYTHMSYGLEKFQQILEDVTSGEVSWGPLDTLLSQKYKGRQLKDALYRNGCDLVGFKQEIH